jgi:cell division protease FtsH
MKRARWLLKKYGATALSVMVVLGVVVWQVSQRADERPEMSLGSMLERADHHEVRAAQIDYDEHKVDVTLDDGRRFSVSYPVEYDDELTDTLKKDGVEELTANKQSFWDSRLGILLFALTPMIVLIGGFFVYTRMRASRKARKKQVTTPPSTRFTDVQGADEAIAQLRQMVDCLKRPDRYRKAGVRFPKGWLFYGPPGTGKTLLARAVAGEAGVTFFSIAGSEFSSKWLGEGAASVRALFDRARTVSFDRPAILFIDEIDAIGGDRDGQHEEYRVTLNQLLAEMDGFLAKDSKVIVIAATNRRDSLDAALLRPGRLTRHVAMPEPDLAARVAVLRGHAKKLEHLDPAVDFEDIARMTGGSSGASLAELVNDAGLLALAEGAPTVTTEHFKDALATSVLGHARRTAVVSEEDRRRVAEHEAGHALAAQLQEHATKPHRVTILPRGATGGATWYLGDERMPTAEYVKETMVAAMAGRAAEKIFHGENFAAAGAEDDISKATELAVKRVCLWGMGSVTSRVEPSTWRSDPAIAEEVDRLVKAAEDAAIHLLNEHRQLLDALVEKLVEAETISGDELRAIVAGASTQRKDLV